MQAFRQWWQTNVDLKQQKRGIFSTGQNITWNVNSVDDLSPIYTDNVYWTLYKNYQNDRRNRFTGNTSLVYDVAKWFNILGRFSFDSYSEIREERTEVGSADPSSYYVNNRNVSEMNYDLMGNFNFNLTNDLNFDGLIGFNLRVNKLNSLGISTNGGIVTPGLFTLANTLNPITSDNIAKTDYTKKVDGLFAKAGVGYKGTYYFDATIRRDRSSTLPKIIIPIIIHLFHQV